MENAKIMTEESMVEWEVPASDDEICEEVDSIPTRVLLLFKQIEKDGFLELETKECRLINSSNETSEEESVHKTIDERKSCQCEEGVGSSDLELEPLKAAKDLEKKCFTTSAFDYDEDLNSGFDQLPKRTPKSDRKTRKRVGVFQDVLSDIKRYRELDAQGEAEEQPAQTKSGEKDNESKTNVPQAESAESKLITTEKSKLETSDDMCSQLSKTETSGISETK